MAEKIYPQDFFQIPQPSAPVANVQFRTKVEKGADIDDPSIWTPITFDPNNFFNEMTIEDNSGYPTLNLTLTDKNYTFLEDKVVQMMVAQRMSNKLVENPNISKDDTGYFEFFIDKKKSANIRVRFGYSEEGLDDYISDPDMEGSDYAGRADSKKTVIKSPWLYFMVTGLDMNVTENGLQVTIQGREATGSFFDNATMIQKYAKLRGSPKNIINRIGEQIEESSKAASEDGSPTIEIKMVDEPKMYKNRDGGEEIEIMLGGKPNIKTDENGNQYVDTEYKKVKQIFNEICSQVSPVMYDENGGSVPVSSDGSKEGKGVDDKSSKMKESYPYTYSFVRKKDKDVVQFYYKDPRKTEQNKMRVYAWLEHGLSIIQNVDINVSQIFSYLNYSLMTYGDDGEKQLYVSSAKEPEEGNQTSEFDSSLGNISNVEKALESQDFDFTFTSGVKNTADSESSTDEVTPGMAAKRMMRRFQSIINENIAKGSITIMGDPYFLFDDKVKPFQHLINIVIKRPNYIDENGEFVEGGRSYLSGNYRVKKATHTISAGQYSTTLEVIKTPF